MDFIKKHPARIYALAVAAVLLVGDYATVNSDHVLGIIAALLSLASGEAVQRTENTKTDEALATPVDPDAMGH